MIVQNCLQCDVCAELSHISLQVVCHKIGKDGMKLSGLVVLLPQSLLAALFYKTEGFFSKSKDCLALFGKDNLPK